MNKPRPIQDVFLFIMRITLTQFLFMVILTSLVSAADINGQGILNRKVSLDVQNTSIKAVLSEMEKQTAVVFSYRPRLIHASKKVSFKVSDASLEDALKELFGSGISFMPIHEEEAPPVGADSCEIEVRHAPSFWARFPDPSCSWSSYSG